MKNLFDAIKALGYSVMLEAENIRLTYINAGRPPVEAKALVGKLKERKAEALEHLRTHGLKPYFDLDGSLVIPFTSDPRFHYWNGGQSIEKTEEEVRSWKALIR